MMLELVQSRSLGRRALTEVAVVVHQQLAERVVEIRCQSIAFLDQWVRHVDDVGYGVVVVAVVVDDDGVVALMDVRVEVEHDECVDDGDLVWAVGLQVQMLWQHLAGLSEDLVDLSNRLVFAKWNTAYNEIVAHEIPNVNMMDPMRPLVEPVVLGL